MTIKEFIKNKILKFLGIERLSSNPNDERLTFISNDDEIKQSEIKANRVWYIGSGDELLNYYTEKEVSGFAKNPIYNRNKRNYFWGLSSQECDIKRIHSGIPRAIIDTLTNIVGMPSIDEPTKEWDKIAEENDFSNKLVQQARPLTLVCGYGAWKINFNSDISEYPLWEFYDAEFVEYIYQCGVLVGIIFKSFYKNAKNEDFVLLETRYKAQGNSYIEYQLFKLKKGNELQEVNLDAVPELKDIPREKQVITGLNKILAVPSRYLYDAQNPKYGKSIYSGKLDFFDMLDEIWSQASQTNRVSTPVEYYNPEVLERGNGGFCGVPNLYNRQFVQKAGVPDGDGNINNDIQTTQPDLNFEKYGALEFDVLGYILTGILSPATLGIDVAKRDNAEAQREKEKVSIMTRNTIIATETKMLREIVTLSLMLKEYIDTGNITLKDYNIEIKYSEFANPSFENELQILGNAWSQGQLPTKDYVEMLWADKISDADKLERIKWLDENKAKSEDMSGLFNENEIK